MDIYLPLHSVPNSRAIGVSVTPATPFRVFVGVLCFFFTFSCVLFFHSTPWKNSVHSHLPSWTHPTSVINVMAHTYFSSNCSRKFCTMLGTNNETPALQQPRYLEIENAKEGSFPVAHANVLVRPVKFDSWSTNSDHQSYLDMFSLP